MRATDIGQSVSVNVNKMFVRVTEIRLNLGCKNLDSQYHKNEFLDLNTHRHTHTCTHMNMSLNVNINVIRLIS